MNTLLQPPYVGCYPASAVAAQGTRLAILRTLSGIRYPVSAIA